MKSGFRNTMSLIRGLAIILLVTIPGYYQGHFSKAEEELPASNQTLEDNASKAREYVVQGVKAFTDQQYSNAVKHFKRAMELDPEIEEAPMYLATSYMLQFVPGSTDPVSDQMAEKAIETFSEIVDRSEENGIPNVNAMLAIASISYQLKDVEKTRQWFNRILQLQATTDDVKKSQTEAHYRLAVLLFDDVHERTGILGEKVTDMRYEDRLQILSSIDEGLSHLEEAVKMRPDYYEAMMYQNLLWRELVKLVDEEYYKQEVTRRADKAYAKAVELKLKAESEDAAQRKQSVPEK